MPGSRWCRHEEGGREPVDEAQERHQQYSPSMDHGYLVVYLHRQTDKVSH